MKSTPNGWRSTNSQLPNWYLRAIGRPEFTCVKQPNPYGGQADTGRLTAREACGELG